MKLDSLTTSDWIALIACVGTFIALIPAFSQMAHNKKMKAFETTTKETGIDDTTVEKEESKPLNGFGKALVLTSIALVFMVIEIVVFSWIASLNGVEVNTQTMPTNWSIVFYALFILPGLALFMAFAFFTSMFD